MEITHDVLMRKINHIIKMKHGSISYEEPITDPNKEITWKCHKCGHTFRRSPAQLLKNTHCIWCRQTVVKPSVEEVKQRMKEIHGDKYEYISSNYDRGKTKRILVRHTECGFIWSLRVDSFLRGTGCPKCKNSLGKRRLFDYLRKRDFLLLENKGEGYYLEENGGKFMIEFIEEGKTVAKNDARFCESNGIEMIVLTVDNEEEWIGTEKLAQRLRGEQFTED